MNKMNINCKRIRSRLLGVLTKNFSPNAKWVQKHVANCPRCRQRIKTIGRVELALEIVKSQVHNLDLLMRANTQAIGVLKHSLREAPKAERLKRILPEPKLFERCAKYNHSVVNAAACILILFLMKLGIFSFTDTFQTRGREAFKQYYARQVGQEMADEIFKT